MGFSTAEIRLEIAQSNNNECSQELIQYLRNDLRDSKEGLPSPLDDVIQKFTKMVAHEHFKFPIACFYENLATKLSSVVRGIPNDKLKEGGIDEDKAQGYTVVCPLQLG